MKRLELRNTDKNGLRNVAICRFLSAFKNGLHHKRGQTKTLFWVMVVLIMSSAEVVSLENVCRFCLHALSNRLCDAIGQFFVQFDELSGLIFCRFFVSGCISLSSVLLFITSKLSCKIVDINVVSFTVHLF